MKTSSSTWLTLIVLGLGGLMPHCQEVGPNVNLEPEGLNLIDTHYLAESVEDPQDKVVLIDEFSGVRCVYCPAGHKELHRLDSIYGEQLAALSIHTSFFAEPYDYSNEDFRTEEGTDIESMLGGVPGYPAGAVDRKKFSGEEDVILNIGKWDNYVSQQLELTPPANIYLETSFDSDDNAVKVLVELHYTTEASEQHHLSVAIIEHGIIDPQLTPDDVDTFYVHEFVLRDMFTPYNGITIEAPKEPGRVIKRGFSRKDIPANWDVSKLEVVAWIHRGGGDELDVLQAAHQPVL